MGYIEKVTITGAQELKNKFKEIRDSLIEKDAITHNKFETYAIEMEPDFDTKEGRKKIFDVYYGRSSSYYLVMLIEEYQKNCA